MKYILKNKDYHIFIVLILSSIVYFIGNTWLGITDPVESNYALTAKEMTMQYFPHIPFCEITNKPYHRYS